MYIGSFFRYAVINMILTVYFILLVLGLSFGTKEKMMFCLGGLSVVFVAWLSKVWSENDE